MARLGRAGPAGARRFLTVLPCTLPELAARLTSLPYYPMADCAALHTVEHASCVGVRVDMPLNPRSMDQPLDNIPRKGRLAGQ